MPILRGAAPRFCQFLEGHPDSANSWKGEGHPDAANSWKGTQILPILGRAPGFCQFLEGHPDFDGANKKDSFNGSLGNIQMFQSILKT